MILEGLVTTLNPDGAVNIAPMGPTVDEAMRRFTLRPFPTALSYRNLVAHGEGVLHVTDDVLLLAQAAVGPVEPPPLTPAVRVRGFVVADSCRAYEFRVAAVDDREPRVRLECEVLHVHRLRDGFGFNRAKHAVVEAAILATRVHLLPLDEIEAEYRKFEVIVGKTGGPREQEAMAFLRRYVAEVRSS